MRKGIGSSPRVRTEGGGRGAVSQAGAVLLVETVRRSGPDAAISAALGGDCLADAGMLRAELDIDGVDSTDPSGDPALGRTQDG